MPLLGCTAGIGNAPTTRAPTVSTFFLAPARQGATVKELRGAIGMTRERLEAAYEYLVEDPPLRLAIQRQGDEFFLVSAPAVGTAVERHMGKPRPSLAPNIDTFPELNR